MPVADLSQCQDEDELLNTPLDQQIDPQIFESIGQHMSHIYSTERKLHNELKTGKKITKAIEDARELIDTSMKRKSILEKQNIQLEAIVADKQERINSALEYWKDYGLEVKLLDQNHLSFNYTNLGCTVELKHEQKYFHIVAHSPAKFTPDQLEKLNKRLSSTCVSDHGTTVDYKLAMLIIKKELSSVRV